MATERSVAGCSSAGMRLLGVLALGALCAFGAAGCSRGAPKYPEVRAQGAEVVIRLDGLNAECGRFYTFRAANGARVDFLVYRDSAGTPHAVLDACRTCFRWKKGYRLDGREVVCIKCDMRFTLDGLERGTGSCVPVRLRSERRGETLVIPAAELETGARFF